MGRRYNNMFMMDSRSVTRGSLLEVEVCLPSAWCGLPATVPCADPTKSSCQTILQWRFRRHSGWLLKINLRMTNVTHFIEHSRVLKLISKIV
jgi:hypothetical protein